MQRPGVIVGGEPTGQVNSPFDVQHAFEVRETARAAHDGGLPAEGCCIGPDDLTPVVYDEIECARCASEAAITPQCEVGCEGAIRMNRYSKVIFIGSAQRAANPPKFEQ